MSTLARAPGADDARPWSWSDFLGSSSPQGPFVGAAISSGSTNQSPAGAALAAPHPGVVLLRSAAGAGSGYRWVTAAPAGLVGGVGLRCRAWLLWPAFVAVVRVGLHDSTTSADPVDGAYLEVSASGVAAFKTAANSVRSTAPAFVQLAAGTWYLVETWWASAVQVRCSIRGDVGPVLFDQVLTATVPAGPARVFQAGVVATKAAAGGGAQDLLCVDWLGVGVDVDN